MIPKTAAGRALVILWAACHVLLLVFAFVYQKAHDMPVAFGWLILPLSFPLSFPGIAAVGTIYSAISLRLGIPYHPFWGILPLWLASIGLGYLQWFVLVPKAVRLIFRSKS